MKVRFKRLYILLVGLGLVVCMVPFRGMLRGPVVAVIQVIRGKKTVAERVEQFEPAVRDRLMPAFDKIGVVYPPRKITLVGIKSERLLELWVSEPPKLLKTYPIIGSSGMLGPKLIEGDFQVPEGLYRIESLNPNSLYHLALRVNYPNDFDKSKAELDGRSNPGSDIMIHGKDCSIGCLAMGDEAAEELFVLAARVGVDNISVILTPVDFRTESLPQDMPLVPAWTKELYSSIRKELEKLGKIEN